MAWNPEKYNQFKTIRYKPFFDLADLVSGENLRDCVDVGCGTGEQTAILSEKFPDANFLGIDSSPEMLADSKMMETDNLKFKLSTIEDFAVDGSKWDLIFSNAALQWSDNHEALFPKLISKLNPSGQFAVQMPSQKENALNRILLEMVSEKPFRDYFDGFVRNSPMLTIEEYAEVMFAEGLTDLDLSVKIYPIIAKEETELFDFISGSALIPYMERLSNEHVEAFKLEYLLRIKKAFGTFPAIYPFKRFLLYGVRK